MTEGGLKTPRAGVSGLKVDSRLGSLAAGLKCQLYHRDQGHVTK